jgi:DNA-directed RNA polymerase sigma subunit (sigma70/sigma32)
MLDSSIGQKSSRQIWKGVTQMDLNRISEILRMLQPRQEKVIRLYFGLGCQRSHSALEIAEAFQVSSQVIAGILGAAERRLVRLGLTPIQMRAAARREAALHHPTQARSLPESKPKSCSGHRARR